MRGYIAMLATRKDYRGHGIATSLVKMALEKMIAEDADEVSMNIQPSSSLLRINLHATDCPRNRSRQHTLLAHLRKPRLHPHKAAASVLPQRQHGVQAHTIPETRHFLQAYLPTRLWYARSRFGGYCSESWLVE